ncbi:WD domain repeat-containing protein 55, partial [Coelomomyces lativittatus]
FPKQIQLKDSIPLSIQFHPSVNQLSVGLVTGDVACYNYEGSTVKRLFLSKHHKDAVRCVRYNDDGSFLFSCSTDKSIQALDTKTHQVILKKSKAHDNPINILSPLTEHTVATADDAGTIRVWDLRAKSMILQYEEHESAVNDLLSRDNELLSIGEDGFLTVYDFKKMALVARSDMMENEMHCMQWTCGGKKLAVGQSDGVISLWNDGWWGDMKDRIPGHPEPITSMVQLSDRQLLTGCGDGKLRLVSVAPNKIERIVANTGMLPVESLCISNDKNLVASCTYDEKIRFWNVSQLMSSKSKQKRKGAKKVSFEDEDSQNESDENDSDSSNDSDDNLKKTLAKRSKMKKRKGKKRKKSS